MSAVEPNYRAIEARFRAYRRLIVALLACGIAANAALFWAYFLPRSPLPPLVTVSEMRAEGPVTLCPGQPLAYAYTLAVHDAAVVEVSTTTLRTAPEVVHVGGGGVEREAFPGPLTLMQREVWSVPEDALPGEYVRLVAVTAPSRVVRPAFMTLAFRVEACG